MSSLAPKTSPDAALGNLLGAALGTPDTARPAPVAEDAPRFTTLRGILAEFERGCGNTIPGNEAPENCLECTRAFADAIRAYVLQDPPAAGVSTAEDAPVAYLTLDEEGSPCMLFFDVAEARAFCEIGEEPAALYSRPAPAAGDALDAARWRAYAKLFPEVSASFLATHAVDGNDPLPTIKGAAITGGYVVVTPAGWDADKATKLRDAILQLFPVNPAYTPRPSDELAAQRKGDA